MSRIIGAVFLTAVLFSSVQAESSIEERSRLIKQLFNSCDYDPWNYPNNITVQVGVSLISLNANDVLNTVETTVLLRQLWVDPRLHWDSNAYGGQNVLSIPSDQVWKPELKLLNSAILPNEKPCGQEKVVISNNGQVLWVTPCHFQSYCNFSSNAPGYDYGGIKNCSLIFGHWVEDGTFLDLQFYKKEPQVDLQLFQDLTFWEVTGSKAEIIQTSSNGGYNEVLPAQINFEINLRSKQWAQAAQPVVASGVGYVLNPIECGAGKRPTPEGTCIDGAEI